jgi:hypothetical protein
VSAIVPFSGTIVRLERGGFGVVEFDAPIGATNSSFGIFSNTLGSSIAGPWAEVRTGARVQGIAEVDDREIAAIMAFSVTLPSS